MSRLRFNRGDMARYVCCHEPKMHPYIGAVVDVLAVSPRAGQVVTDASGQWIRLGLPCDYVVVLPDGCWCCVLDNCLAPIDPPAEPASLTRCTDLQEPVTA